MGGLVAKNAVILGHDNSDLQPLVKRVCAIFFVATPHQGVNLAVMSRRLLTVALGSRSTVHNLSHDSILLEAINEQFPQYCAHLQLFSFFENKPMNLGWGRSMIVEKQSALMNLANERKMYLNADHRNVVRFSSTQDPSYITVRNALATCIASKRPTKTAEPGSPAYTATDVSVTLNPFLGISQAPEDEVMAQDSVRTPGSCEWILSRDSFQQWQDSACSTTYWLYGRPGAGKSILAGHIVNYIRDLGRDCCFFFFTDRDGAKSSVNSFLRSMAWQMALVHKDMMSAIAALSGNWRETPLSKVDHSSVWQKLYWRGILKVRLNRPQYWIIDALDECNAPSELTSVLAKIQEVWPVCILVLSRNPPNTYMSTANLKTEMVSEPIPGEDTRKDILLYLKENVDLLPDRLVEPESLIDNIVQSSNGCFLWVDLVLKELRQVTTLSEMKQVLTLTPEKMDDVYTKILTDMSDHKFGKDLAMAILTWSTCSFRPLSTEEIHRAAELHVKDTVVDIEKFISTNCGNLVYVDNRGQVRLIHSTARDFLMRQESVPQFIIEKPVAHRQLALASLRSLSSTETKIPRFRKPSVPQNDGPESPFFDYASRFLFDHLTLVKSYDDSVFAALYKFLASSNVLNWIEYLATHADIQRVFQAGEAIRNLLSRRRHHTLPLAMHKEIALIEPWANDLIHLVMKFGKNLSLSPASIHNLIPPFCPKSSALKQQFASSVGGLAVHGLSTSNWDDCVSTINCPKPARLVTVATSDVYFAVGSSTGNIGLYDNTTCQECQMLDHRERVRCLTFGETGKYLASSGAKTVRVWSLISFSEALTISIPSRCLELTFIEEDSVLLGAIDSNQLISWDISNGDILCDDNWTLDFEYPSSLQHKQAMAATFSVHQGLLAITYRGEDIALWNFESSRYHATYEKGVGYRPYDSPKRSTASSTVRSLAFSPAIDTSLLVAAYNDGYVVIYDTHSNTAQGILAGANAVTVSCSPDGRTLATGDPKGTIQLYDLETLKPIYRLRFDGGSVVLVNFTSDCHRLIDTRSQQCRVWEPATLLRQDTEDENSDTLSVSTGTQEVDYQPPSLVNITALATVRSASTIFCGKEDGSVHVYDTSSEPQSQEIPIMASKVPILRLHFEASKGFLTCSNMGGHVVCRQVTRDPKSRWEVGEPLFSVSRERNVFDVLTSVKHSRLLMSTNVDDTLWQLPGDKSTSHIARIENKEKRCWVQHEPNPDQLVCMTTSEVRIYHWATLECLSCVPLSDSMVSPFIEVDSIIPLRHSNFFATIAKDPTQSVSTQTVLQVWDLRNITADLKTATCVYNVGSLSSNVERVIGVVGNRLVFLNNSYWVCSADLENRDGEEGPVQHFFFPYDWLSSMNRSMLDIGQNGEIVFIKRGEMAVIRHGLEVTERGAFTPTRKRGASPRRGSLLGLPFRTEQSRRLM